MSIAGGGHVKLNGVTYKLAEDYNGGPPIRTDLEPLATQTTSIAGLSAEKSSARPELRYAPMDDWRGGEGAKVWDEQDPTQYYTGKGNGRNPGFFTATPLREDSSVHAALTATTTQAFATNGGGYVWVASCSGDGEAGANQRRLRFSSDVNTWTSSLFDGSISLLADPQIVTAITAGPRFLFVATIDYSASANPNVGDLFVYWLDMSTNAFRIGDVYDMAQHGTTAARYAGMDILSVSGSGSATTSKLFGWTGQKLWSYDLSSLPDPIANSALSRTAEYTASMDKFIGVAGTAFFADCVATDNSIVMFYCNPDQKPLVWEYKDGVGRPIITNGLPDGFTCRAITYSLGNLYLAGTFNDKGAVFGMNLVTYQPFFVGFLHYDADLTQVTPRSIAPGIGTQVIVGCNSGFMFVIDFEGDKPVISQLDQRSGVGHVVDTTTFGSYRVGIFNDTTEKQIKASRWSPDDVPSTSGSNGGGDGTATRGMFDGGLPFETKALLGYKVISEPLSGSKTVTIGYDNDETGSFTSLTTLPATTGAVTQITTGDHYIAVSGPSDASSGPTSTVKWRILRDKVTVAGGAKVYSYTPIYKAIGYSRVWTLAIDLRWPSPGQDENQIGAKRQRPETVRAALDALRTSGSMYTFIDGTDKVTPGQVSTYKVFVEDAFSAIEQPKNRSGLSANEGIYILKLREVAISAA